MNLNNNQNRPAERERELIREKEQEQYGQEQTKKNVEFSFSFKEQDKLDAELRKPRSKVYLELFSAIDMLSATDEEIIAKLKENLDEDTAEEFAQMSKEELLEEIKLSFQEEFQNLEIPVETVLQGVISKCYIDGCDCHAIDSVGNILDHFSVGDKMPDELATGRIAFNRYPNCACVEVYSNCCRVIDFDGEVIKITNQELNQEL